MNIIRKIGRVFKTLILAIVGLFVLAFVGIASTAVLLLTIQQIVHMFLTWNHTDLMQSVFKLVMMISILDGLLLTSLNLFKDGPFKQKMKRILLWPLEAFMWIFSLFTPYLVLVGFLIVIVIAWAMLMAFHILPPINNTVSQYAIFVITSVFFTLMAERSSRWLVRWIRSSWDVSWLFNLLKPSIVRVYIYFLLAAGYLFSNLEKFSGLVLVQWPWWIQFKDVLVEVLLTYAAIDGVLTAWRDHWESNPCENIFHLLFTKIAKRKDPHPAPDSIK